MKREARIKGTQLTCTVEIELNNETGKEEMTVTLPEGYHLIEYYKEQEIEKLRPLGHPYPKERSKKEKGGEKRGKEREND